MKPITPERRAELMIQLQPYRKTTREEFMLIINELLDAEEYWRTMLAGIPLQKASVWQWCAVCGISQERVFELNHKSDCPWLLATASTTP